MFRINYHYNNRSNNYVPFDYAYNILQSVGKDGIVFTNGDNDTFPHLVPAVSWLQAGCKSCKFKPVKYKLVH